MRLRAIIRLATFIAIIVGIVSHMTINTDAAQAATYYVATTGSNSNTCGQAQNITTPKQGLSSAIACLAAGDTLLVRGGTYIASTQTQSIPSGTSWSSPVTIRAYPGDAPVLVGNVAGSPTLYFNNGNHHIIIDGFIIDATGTLNGVKVMQGSHHIRIINSEIKNANFTGVITADKASGTTANEFINLIVHNNGLSTQFDHGFYIETDGDLIDGCEIYGNTGYGIQVYQANASNVTIRNNRIHDHVTKAGVILGTGTGHKVYNNIFYNSSTSGGLEVNYGSVGDVYNNTFHGRGIAIYASGTGLTVDNNIFWAATGGAAIGIYIEGAGNAVTVRNNLSSNNANGNYVDNNNRAVLSNNLIGDQYNPNFLNAAGRDYRLQIGSAAIDAGRTISGLTTDSSGNPRSNGAAYDIGAFEFQDGTLGTPSNVKAVSQ